MVSISPATPPEALSRSISPARPDWLSTVIVWVPGRAEVHSGAHSARVTVTIAVAAGLAAGSTAIVVPAASDGTTTSTPATAHGRRPASRSQRPAVPVPLAAAEAAGPGAARPAWMNAGMTTPR